MPEYKQGKIAEELTARISDGFYKEKLPPSTELADEFGVNFKTVNKVLNQLTKEGLLFRKKGCGTFIRPRMVSPENKMIEILFEGYTTVSTHPYWGPIWSGVMKKISDSGYRPVLSMLSADDSGILKLDSFQFCETSGKLLLGVTENRLIRMLKDWNRSPFVCTADPVDDPDVFSVFIEDLPAMRSAVAHLYSTGARRIAFIGVTYSYTNNRQADRFRAYLDAIQQYQQSDPRLIEHARLLSENGYPAMKNILSRIIPDAVIVSGNHMIPGVVRALEEAGLKVPSEVRICGCDGVETGLPFPVPTIHFDKQKCGEAAAELLIRLIEQPCKGGKNIRIKSEFSAD